MPKYRVHFTTPMRYLPNHSKGRDVVDLEVWADSPQHALQHAIKVTEGDGLADPPVEILDA